MKRSSVSITLTRSMIRYAVSRGADLAALCKAAGIDEAILSQPEKRISGDQSRRLWEAAVHATGDPDFGLHLGELSQPASLGLVGFTMISAPDLGTAFDRLLRYTNLLTDGVRGTITRSNGEALFDLTPTSNLDNFLLETPRQHVECTLSAFPALAHALTGKPLPVISTWFCHPAPHVVSEHRRIFRTDVRFGRPVNRVGFREEALGWPLVDANPELLRAFDAQAVGALKALDGTASWNERGERAIVEKLRGSLPGLDEIARHLGVSSRQFQRHLGEEGTGFRQLLDRARHGLALRYLRHQDIPIAEISHLLGFAEPSAFHRSFRRWTGSSPGNVRKSFHDVAKE